MPPRFLPPLPLLRLPYLARRHALCAHLIAHTQVRIYQVKKEDPLGRDLKSANAFAQGKKKKKSKPLVRRKAIV